MTSDYRSPVSYICATIQSTQTAFAATHKTSNTIRTASHLSRPNFNAETPFDP